MPVKMRENPNRPGKYTVSTPGGVKGRKMTLRNAKRQARLLNAIDHGWKPTNKKQ
jgi:hypothetical protein